MVASVFIDCSRANHCSGILFSNLFTLLVNLGEENEAWSH